MQQITILCVGKIKEDYLRDAVETEKKDLDFLMSEPEYFFEDEESGTKLASPEQLLEVKKKLLDGRKKLASDLETAERNIIDNNSASATDTLYIVTGPVYQTVNGNESYSTIAQSGKMVPVANYYYRVILKVRRNASGTVTAASAIGFWMPHSNSIADDDYTNYACSVSSIEEKTGFTFFANLPSSVSSSAKANTSWTSFKNFSF